MEKTNRIISAVMSNGYKTWKVVSNRWFIGGFIVLIAITGFMLATNAGINYVNKNEPVRQPMIIWDWPTIQTPLYFRERKPTIILTPVVVEPTKDKKVEELTKEEKRAIIYEVAKNYPRQIERIWLLETTEGMITENSDPTATHVFCNRLGLTNEFGFDPQGRGTGNRCFNTFEDSVKAVDELLTDFLGKYTLNQALCLYSGNGVTNACNYLEKYMTL